MEAKKLVLRGVAAAALTLSGTNLVQKTQACQYCGYSGDFPGGVWFSYCYDDGSNNPGYNVCTGGDMLQDCTVSGLCGNWG